MVQIAFLSWRELDVFPRVESVATGQPEEGGRKEGRKEGSGSRILLYKRSEAGAISGFLV